MESISIIDSGSVKSRNSSALLGSSLALSFAFFFVSYTFTSQAAEVKETFQQNALKPETPPSPHSIHWYRGRTFTFLLANQRAELDEKNAASTASFSEKETMITGLFQRQVSPSIGLLTEMSHIKADSSFHSQHAGITNDVERKVRSSIASVGGSYKIMDALILALQVGFQTSQLVFAEKEAFSVRAYRVSPALAWKASSYEIALYQMRLYQSKSGSGKSQFAEQGLTLSTIQSSQWQWQVWLQHNPQPVCCAFADSKRTIYGGRVFLPWSSFEISPGYRFLSEFQSHQHPGSIEDVARHDLFVSVATKWDEWNSNLSLGYAAAAKTTAPSSFGSSPGVTTKDRSEIEASSLRIAVAFGRLW